MGVTTAYHAVDDVAEVNGSIPPMLPGSFLREKEPGYEASGTAAEDNNTIFIF